MINSEEMVRAFCKAMYEQLEADSWGCIEPMLFGVIADFDDFDDQPGEVADSAASLYYAIEAGLLSAVKAGISSNSGSGAGNAKDHSSEGQREDAGRVLAEQEGAGESRQASADSR